MNFVSSPRKIWGDHYGLENHKHNVITHILYSSSPELKFIQCWVTLDEPEMRIFLLTQPQLPLIKSKVLLTTNMAIHQILSLGFCPPSALISTFDSDVWSKIGPKLSPYLLEKKSFNWQYNHGRNENELKPSNFLKVKWQRIGIGIGIVYFLIKYIHFTGLDRPEI